MEAREHKFVKNYAALTEALPLPWRIGLAFAGGHRFESGYVRKPDDEPLRRVGADHRKLLLLGLRSSFG